jgi:hypothetical protein
MIRVDLMICGDCSGERSGSFLAVVVCGCSPRRHKRGEFKLSLFIASILRSATIDALAVGADESTPWLVGFVLLCKLQSDRIELYWWLRLENITDILLCCAL